MTNYYKILGVRDFASQEEIKTAYRKLTKKFHPDVNDGDKFFEERFKEVQNAYEVLSDNFSRVKHDNELKDIYKTRTEDYSNRTNQSKYSDQTNENSSWKGNQSQNDAKKENSNIKNKKAGSSSQSIFSTPLTISIILTIVFVGFIITKMKRKEVQVITTEIQNIDTEIANIDTIKSKVIKYKNEIIFGEEKLRNEKSKTEQVKIKKKLSDDYNIYGWNSFFLKKYDELIPIFKRSIELNPNNLYPQTNLPPAYLFNNQFENAKAEYLRLKNLKYNHKDFSTFKDVFLNDINAFEKAGLINDSILKTQVENIVELLDRKDYFSIGSTMDIVLQVQGQPKSVNDNYSYVVWQYNSGTIEFDKETGRVKAYNNPDGMLRVRL